VTEEKETPEAEETETPAETAEAEAPEETAEAEAPEETAEAPAEAAEAEAAEKPAETKEPKEERYTRQQLQRLTTTKLREIAFELGEVVGVHGMKKDELVEAVFQLRGIEEADAVAEVSIDKTAIKSEIRELKALRDSALETGNALELKRVRKRIKRLKRALRKVS
jgi:DNA-nicking Smr family endonuclease